AAVGAPLACLGHSDALRLGGPRSGRCLSGGGNIQPLKVAAEVAPERRMAQRVLDRRLKVSELAATIVTLTLEAVGVYGFFPHQRSDTVGELDFPARTATDALQVLG